MKWQKDPIKFLYENGVDVTHYNYNYMNDLIAIANKVAEKEFERVLLALCQAPLKSNNDSETKDTADDITNAYNKGFNDGIKSLLKKLKESNLGWYDWEEKSTVFAEEDIETMADELKIEYHKDQEKDIYKNKLLTKFADLPIEKLEEIIKSLKL